MSEDKKISVPYWDGKCPNCNSISIEQIKGSISDWVREYKCNNCHILFYVNEGDKMGGQFDTITILKTNQP